jgi:hypothetical protein
MPSEIDLRRKSILSSFRRKCILKKLVLTRHGKEPFSWMHVLFKKKQFDSKPSVSSAGASLLNLFPSVFFETVTPCSPKTRGLKPMKAE